MGEKEQVQAIELLKKWLEFESAADKADSFAAVDAALMLRSDLIRETRKFLTLDTPESHGQRRG